MGYKSLSIDRNFMKTEVEISSEAKKRILNYMTDGAGYASSDVVENCVTKIVKEDEFYIRDGDITRALEGLVKKGKVDKEWKPTSDGGYWKYFKKSE